MSTAERTVTIRLHLPWDEESSERLYAACRTQDACWNLALDYLIEHPDEPLRKSNRLGVKGLQGRWLEWRQSRPWAKAVPQAIWRGGVLRAAEQVERWEQVNEQHAKAYLKALEDGKDIPRRVQRRYPDPKKLTRRKTAVSLQSLKLERLRDRVRRAHGRAATHPLRPGDARAAWRTRQRPAGDVQAARKRGAWRAARRTQGGVRTPRSKVHRNPGEELIGFLSGVPSLHQRKPQEPSAIPVHQVRARGQRGLQCSEEPPAVRDVRETQGCGQAVLGGVRSSKAPSWRGQPGQGTGGKPGQRPGAATGPRARADPASRKGLSTRHHDGCKGERVRGNNTCSRVMSQLFP